MDMRLIVANIALFAGLLAGVILVLAADHGNFEDAKLSIGVGILGVFVFIATIGVALLVCQHFPAWCPNVAELVAIFFD